MLAISSEPKHDLYTDALVGTSFELYGKSRQLYAALRFFLHLPDAADFAMEHIVEECGDDTGALRNLCSQIGKAGYRIVSVLWLPPRPGAKPGYVVVASK